MSEDQKYERSKPLWTTDKDKWFLVRNASGHYQMYRVEEGITSSVLYEIGDEHNYVVSKMIENNVPIITMKEFMAMFPPVNVPLWRNIMVSIGYIIGLFLIKIIETIYKIKLR